MTGSSCASSSLEGNIWTIWFLVSRQHGGISPEMVNLKPPMLHLNSLKSSQFFVFRNKS